MTIKKCKNIINDLLRGEGSINETSKIFEISDQLIYVYLTKILINLSR
jgi:DNA invertase Pin-like site-specific DNA recombinase